MKDFLNGDLRPVSNEEMESILNEESGISTNSYGCGSGSGSGSGCGCGSGSGSGSGSGCGCGSGSGEDDGQQPKPKFDIAKAVDKLEKDAKPYSVHKCGHYVMNAIDAGLGFELGGRPRDAKDMGKSFLPRAGFVMITFDADKYVPRPGDVVVFDGFDGHESGHAAMFGNKAWYSDFKQRDMYGGSAYREPGRVFNVYRHLK